MSKRSTRVDLGTKVHQLRLQRHWTQARLARALGVTQGQLSKLERGERTFKADHLVALLKQFNLTLDDLTQPARDTAAQLQNALARQGATHLAETPELLPSAKLRAATVAIREALVSADSARQIAAVAPVFVANAGKINLVRLRNEFAELGLESRLCWAIDSTRAAIQTELPRLKAREWRLKYQHALTVLEATFSSFLNRAPPARDGEPNSYEVLDPEITTLKTLEEVISDASLRSNDHRKLAARLESDVKALFALYNYGSLHRSVRLRWGFLDEHLHVDWALEGDPSLYEILQQACDEKKEAEVVVGSAPGWADPWARTQRFEVVKVDFYQVVARQGGEQFVLARDEVQAVRIVS